MEMEVHDIELLLKPLEVCFHAVIKAGVWKEGLESILFRSSKDRICFREPGLFLSVAD